MSFSFAQVQSQELPPKHRGMHPILKADGTVVDETGKALGSIKNGKVCDVTGKVIGIISGNGDVTTSSGKSVGKNGRSRAEAYRTLLLRKEKYAGDLRHITLQERRYRQESKMQMHGAITETC